MCLQKGLPGRGASTHRVDSVLCQDSFDGTSTNGVSQIRERALDSRVAPSRVVSRHLEDEALGLPNNPRSSWAALLAPIVLLRDEVSVPAKKRVGRDDYGDLAEPTPSDWLCSIGFARRASRRRCASLNRRRFPLRCSRRTPFSSWRYSIISCCWRFTHPAKRSSRNCSGSGVMAGRLARHRRQVSAVRKRSGLRSTPRFHGGFVSPAFWHTTSIGIQLQLAVARSRSIPRFTRPSRGITRHPRACNRLPTRGCSRSQPM